MTYVTHEPSDDIAKDTSLALVSCVDAVARGGGQEDAGVVTGCTSHVFEFLNGELRQYRKIRRGVEPDTTTYDYRRPNDMTWHTETVPTKAFLKDFVARVGDARCRAARDEAMRLHHEWVAAVHAETPCVVPTTTTPEPSAVSLGAALIAWLRQRPQEAAILLGAALLTLAIAFPPWYQQFNRAQGTRVSRPIGFAPIWRPPKVVPFESGLSPNLFSVRLDGDRLAAECFAIAAGTAAVAFVTRRRRPAPD